MTIKVVCVKWGDKYPAEYVNKLYSMVGRNLTKEFEFYCFTDDGAGLYPAINIIDLDEGREGWWNKLQVFDGRYFSEGDTILFFDLDVVITGNIDFLIDQKPSEKFLGVLDFIFPDKTYNSSVFRFTVGELGFVNRAFKKATKMDNGNYKYQFKEYIGDQDLITDLVYPAGIHKYHAYEGDYIVSYKRHIKENPPTERQRVVVFHGKPDPHEVSHDWVRKHWR